MARLSSLRTAALAAGILLPLSAPLNPAAAAACETQFDQALQQLQIPQDDVKSMKVMKRSRGAKSPTNFVYDAWIRLNSCSGYLVVSASRGCVVQQSYTTGDCRLGDLPRN